MKKTIASKIKNNLFSTKKKWLVILFIITSLIIIFVSIGIFFYKVVPVIENASSAGTSSSSNGPEFPKTVPPSTNINQSAISKVSYDILSATPILSTGKFWTKLSLILGIISGVLGIIIIGLSSGAIAIKVKKTNSEKKSVIASRLLICSSVLMTIALIMCALAIFYGISLQIRALDDFIKIKNQFSHRYADILEGAGKVYKHAATAAKNQGLSDAEISQKGEEAVSLYITKQFQIFENDFIRPKLNTFIAKYNYAAGSELVSVLNTSLLISEDLLTVNSAPQLGIDIPAPDGVSKTAVVKLIVKSSEILRGDSIEIAKDVFSQHQSLLKNMLDKSYTIILQIWNQLYY